MNHRNPTNMIRYVASEKQYLAKIRWDIVNGGISPHSFCCNFHPSVSGRNQYFGCFRDYISGGLRVVGNGLDVIGNGLDVIGNGLRVTSYLLCVVCKVLYVMGLYITIYALGVNALGVRRKA